MPRLVVSCLVSMLVLVCAQAAAAKGPVRFFGLEFPDRIAGSARGDHKDFEKTSPGLGHGVDYRAKGWNIDVYIYDLGKKSIPDDVKTVVISSQFEQARGDIFAAGEKGLYENVKIRDAFVLPDIGGHPRFQCASFTFVHKKSGEVDSYLCVTGWKGKFVKFRMTTKRRASSDSDFRVYMGAWMAHLWPGR